MDSAPSGMVPEHAPPPDLDWGENAAVQPPSEKERRKAVAPSEMAGERLFARLFKQDSRTYVWRVHLRTPRHLSSRHRGLPAGFPEPCTFWQMATSMRVFAFGFETYKQLYPEDCWAKWLKSSSGDGSVAQALRMAMLETPLAQWTPVQRSIFRYTVDQALWHRAPLAKLSKPLRIQMLWQRARSVHRVRKYAKAWLAHHQERGGGQNGSTTDPASGSEGRVSPSLLLARRR